MKLSSQLIRASEWVVSRLAVLCFVGSTAVQAQGLNQVQKGPESVNPFARWLQASELPVQASGADATEKKPGLVGTALNWFRTKELPGDMQIHGFASQAYITTSDNDVFGNSDKGGSFGLTEAGLNVSLRPLPKLQVSAQMLSRRAGKGNTGMPRLDYAFLDYRLYSHEANQFGIRMGRLKNPFGFYNDTRDVAFTRPSILLPQSIYFDRTRNLGLSGDSVQLYSDLAHSRFGTFTTQFGIWFPIVSDADTKMALLQGKGTGHLTREMSYIGRGIYETIDKRIRLAVSGIWINTGYNPGISDSLKSGSAQFSPVYFSAQYNTERWSLTSEYAIRHFILKDFGGPKLDFFGESFYVQGEYRFTPKWEGVLRYDVLFTDRSDKDGSRWVAQDPSKRTGQEHSRYAKDITVGLRWNITPEFMLRAEYHHVNGTGWLAPMDNLNSFGILDTEKVWDLYAIQASYRF